MAFEKTRYFDMEVPDSRLFRSILFKARFAKFSLKVPLSFVLMLLCDKIKIIILVYI